MIRTTRAGRALPFAVSFLAALTAVACRPATPALPSPPVVRVLYVIPQDRPYRADYRAALAGAMIDLQAWYRDQLEGRTFSLYSREPEVCRLPQPASYYAIDSWSKVTNDVQRCAPVSYRSRGFTWLLYVDIVHACNAPGSLGRGATGVAMVARQDLDGLVGAPVVGDCGEPWVMPIARYIGGGGHELGHAFGLRHPPGCDSGSPDCDGNALMWAGYAAYPDTHLRPEDRQILAASRFIR